MLRNKRLGAGSSGRPLFLNEVLSLNAQECLRCQVFDAGDEVSSMKS